MEDQYGNAIPLSVRKQVVKDAKKFWQEKHNQGIHLDIFGKIGWNMREEFRAALEAEHPWLRLCENHWKADQVWINTFSHWTPAGSPNGTPSGTLKRENPIDESQPGPSSKRPKTTNDKIPVSTRPKPIKKTTGQTSNPLYLNSRTCHSVIILILLPPRANIMINPDTYIVPVDQVRISGSCHSTAHFWSQ